MRKLLISFFVLLLAGCSPTSTPEPKVLKGVVLLVLANTHFSRE